MRRSLLAASVMVLALGAWSRASAASTVTIYADFGSPGLYVSNSLGVPLGAVNVVVENATAFDLNTALPGVSAADSVYVVRPLPAFPGMRWS